VLTVLDNLANKYSYLRHGEDVANPGYPLGISTQHPQLTKSNTPFLGFLLALLGRIVDMVLHLGIFERVVAARLRVLEGYVICRMVVSQVFIRNTRQAVIAGVLLT